MTVENKRVVACTPYGRAETVEILFRYLQRDYKLGVLDEWQLWMNTDPEQYADREYAALLERDNEWITVKYPPAGRNLQHKKQFNTRTFFEYCTDPDTVYVRFDDDIVYVHDDAILNLVKHRLHSNAFVSFPVIWNNAISTWFLQQHGSIPREWGDVKPYCMDPVGWADGNFAVRIHNLLLDHIEAGTVDSLLMYHNAQLPEGEQFSVSCFACTSEEYHEHCDVRPGYIDHTDDEAWHSVEMPRKLHRPNDLVGNSLISHYTFFPQREVRADPSILNRYREAGLRLVKWDSIPRISL